MLCPQWHLSLYKIKFEFLGNLIILEESDFGTLDKVSMQVNHSHGPKSQHNEQEFDVEDNTRVPSPELKSRERSPKMSIFYISHQNFLFISQEVGKTWRMLPFLEAIKDRDRGSMSWSSERRYQQSVQEKSPDWRDSSSVFPDLSQP